jgi:hypothetical protein
MLFWKHWRVHHDVCLTAFVSYLHASLYASSNCVVMLCRWAVHVNMKLPSAIASFAYILTHNASNAILKAMPCSPWCMPYSVCLIPACKLVCVEQLLGNAMPLSSACQHETAQRNSFFCIYLDAYCIKCYSESIDMFTMMHALLRLPHTCMQACMRWEIACLCYVAEQCMSTWNCPAP